MLIHDEEKETGGEGCVPPEVAAVAAAGFHGHLTGTYSHTADRQNGLDLRYEIRF